MISGRSSWLLLASCAGLLYLLNFIHHLVQPKTPELVQLLVLANFKSSDDKCTLSCGSNVTEGLPSSVGEEPIILLPLKWGKSIAWNENWTARVNTSLLHLNGCPHKCRFTFDLKRYEKRAHLVFAPTFYWNRDKYLRKLTAATIIERQGSTGQLWIGITTESPIFHDKKGQQLDGVFHWFSNYRKDADVRWTYGTVKTLAGFSLPAMQSQRKKNDKKLIAWLVSDCKTPSKRELLVQSLMRYVPVHIYGKCGSRKCPHNCRKYLAKNYKFYLAFENSLCLDYVTEKLFYSLREDIIPITYAWMNDSNLAPPHSYINALDFKSVRALADYLVHLDAHEEEYEKYFEWKRSYEIGHGSGLCQACSMLLNQVQSSKGILMLPRKQSMLRWLNTLPSSNADGNDSFAEFRVGDKFLRTKNVCVDPSKTKLIMDWMSSK